MLDWVRGSHHVFVHGTKPGHLSVPHPRKEPGVGRVNITLPRRVLHAIDKHAARSGETRSGFLARAALDEMRKGA